MAALTRESANQYRIDFRELLRGKRKKGEGVEVDPYAIVLALGEVMRACTVRAASGKPLLWNEYRVILASADFEPLGALAGALALDVENALAKEVGACGAELVGELRVSVVADEAGELAPGQAVVRTGFAPSERKPGKKNAAMTVRFDEWALAHREASYVLRWPNGEAAVAVGVALVVGRPHPDAPAHFIALEGASARINKEHFVLTAGASKITIGRPATANPISVNGKALAPGGQIESAAPIEISLSRGDLLLVLSKA